MHFLWSFRPLLTFISQARKRRFIPKDTTNKADWGAAPSQVHMRVDVSDSASRLGSGSAIASPSSNDVLPLAYR